MREGRVLLPTKVAKQNVGRKGCVGNPLMQIGLKP